MVRLSTLSEINPIVFSEKVNRQYLRYRLSRLPLKDKRLRDQAQSLVGQPDRSPFIKGPYVSLSKAIMQGKTVQELVKEGIFHEDLPHISKFETLYRHQEKAVRNAKNGKNIIISTGTGSGKTEAFLFPIISECLNLRDKVELKGIAAVLIYPMNALANDQRDRLRELLAGTYITYGIYTGPTFESKLDVERACRRMAKGQGRDIYQNIRENPGHDTRIPIPWEERASVEEMQEDPPNILITNVKQLELILTRAKDVEIFRDNSLSFIVVDEAHTFSGVGGSESAILIRRLREFCGKDVKDIIHIGTSATIVDPSGDSEAAARRFGSRFFGVDPDSMSLISEEYEERAFPDIKYKSIPIPEARDKYGEFISAIEEGNAGVLAEELKKILGIGVDSYRLAESLYEIMQSTEIVQALHEVLQEPKHINSVVDQTWANLGRGKVTGMELEAAKAEVLLWLALCAAAEKDGDRLFRPKLHYFVRGLEGAVAHFELKEDKWIPILAESRKDAMIKIQRGGAIVEHLDTKILDIYYCKECGQHYYSKKLADFKIEKEKLKGGQAGRNNGECYWIEDLNGSQAIFTDNPVGIDEDEIAHSDSPDLYICPECGLLQRNRSGTCLRTSCNYNGSLIGVFAVAYDKPTDYCISCGAYSTRKGGRGVILEARAVQVADVHILAQELIQYLPEGHKKLLAFADSRQDAAFQAAWMHDHARRYRLRQLIYQAIRNQQWLSTHDIVAKIIDMTEDDRSLLSSVAPELEEMYPSGSGGREFENDKRDYFHIYLLRDICEGSGRIESLENWGLLKVEYEGFGGDDWKLKDIARKFSIQINDLIDFINIFLDHWRTSGFVFSPKTLLYSKPWDERSKWIKKRWLLKQPQYPKVLMLETATKDPSGKTKGIISKRGTTWAMRAAGNVFEDIHDIQGLLEDIWNYLLEKELLVRVDTTDPYKNRRKGGSSFGPSGYQINEAKFRIGSQVALYSCQRCGIVYSKPTPKSICVKWRCKGEVIQEIPSEENYDVSVLLREQFNILRPREHTAQVPQKLREKIEAEFKSGTGVNCIVATPTLELGIDIGDLDGILMRNVPPAPSNYWQRAGRAGRRHRMAVIYTYCRNTHHDLSYFDSPLTMLRGTISPPRINLRNEHMVKRHINGIALSVLRRLESPANTPIGMKLSDLSETDRNHITETLDSEIPRHISGLIVKPNSNEYRDEPPKLNDLASLCNIYEAQILDAVSAVYHNGYWPDEDQIVLTEIDDKAKEFAKSIELEFRNLFKNFNDAREIVIKYNELLKKIRPDESHKKFAERIKKYMEGMESRKDLETYTLNVLASRGVLPGYGFNESGVIADYSSESSLLPSFTLTRSKSQAVREFVPGNKLYANGGQFIVGRYAFPPEEGIVNNFTVDLDKKGILLLGEPSLRPVRSEKIKSVPISDSTLFHISRIRDDEEYAFRLSVGIQIAPLGEGYRGIRHYKIDNQEMMHLLHYIGMQMTYLNVGPRKIYDLILAGESKKLGYPICPDCGALRSPLDSQQVIAEFLRYHRDELNHKNVGLYGLEARFDADYLSIGPFKDPDQALSVGWAIVIGAMDHIELEPDDLDVVDMPNLGSDSYSVWIIDKYPGGSGLLEQLIQYWGSIVRSAKNLCENCFTGCENSCQSCLQLYENQRDHERLNRKNAFLALDKFMESISLHHVLGELAKYEKPVGDPDTAAVEELARKLHSANLLSGAQFDSRIFVESLGFHIRPDIYLQSANGVQICIYVDGSIHEVPEIWARDQHIRSNLKNNNWKVYVLRNQDVRDEPRVEDLIRKLSEDLYSEPIRDNENNILESIKSKLSKFGMKHFKTQSKVKVKYLGNEVDLPVTFSWEIPGRPKAAIIISDGQNVIGTELPIKDVVNILRQAGWKIWQLEKHKIDNNSLEKITKEISKSLGISV